ncbi:MAG: FG-GAP repeat domain-containing protein, partial [Candidatus Hodarchaeota archaeon]
MRRLKNLSFQSLQDSINLFFFILNISSILTIILGLIDFILLHNLLNFIIFNCIAIFIILGIPLFIYMKIRKKIQNVISFKRARKTSLKLTPIFIGIFIIITIFSKQYGLTICISIILFGYILGYIFSPKINRKYRRSSRLLLALIITSIIIPFGFFARGTFEPRSESQVWRMYEIDNPGFLLPNGLDVADVNGDGFLDYLTNYEWDGKIRIAFHPGLSNVKKSWPAITIGSIENAESAAFGDFDGDGNFDVVVAHGSELFTHSGVFLIWGPTPSNVMDASAWLEGGDI